MPEHKYGKRVCLQCGKEFEALRPWQVTCGAKCAGERCHALKLKSNARGYARRKKYLLDLLAELDAAYSEMEWLNCRCESVLSKSARREGIVDELMAELRQARETQEASCAVAEKPKVAPGPDAASQPVEKVAARAGLPPLQECPRMRLKAVSLPCGEHEYCHKPTRCARLGGDPDASIVLEPGEKICKRCGTVFTPNSPAQKYCTKKCQETALKEKIYRRK